MTDPKKPTPVAILVDPQVDGVGNPSCMDCLLEHQEAISGFLFCMAGADTQHPDEDRSGGYEHIPGPKCPVHGPPETRAKAF